MFLIYLIFKIKTNSLLIIKVLNTSCFNLTLNLYKYGDELFREIIKIEANNYNSILIFNDFTALIS